MTKEEIAWLSGIFEGEASFCIRKDRNSKLGLTCQISVQMNDEDIIQKIFDLTRLGNIYKRPPRNNSKESHVWMVGSRKDVKYILELLLPWLGKRRTDKAMQMLKCIEICEDRNFDRRTSEWNGKTHEDIIKEITCLSKDAPTVVVTV